MKITRALCLAHFSLLAASVLFAGNAAATKLTPSGQLDFSYGSDVQASGGEATAYKPESKLFYTEDERWWAVLGTSGTSTPDGVHLYALDASHQWQEVLQFAGADAWAKADALYDGGILYVSLRDNRSITGNPRNSLLYRVQYLGAGQWATPAGPTLITSTNPETLVIARDSLGRLWTAFEASRHVRVGNTAPDDTAFSFADLAVSSVESDDIATVISFGTDASSRRLGVLWSDQVSGRVRFAWRFDSDPLDSSAWHFETAYGDGVGGCPTQTAAVCADDHLNAKVIGDEIYVATKTGLNDPDDANPADPLIVLLHRDAAGAWSVFPVSPVSVNATRPIVLVAPTLDLLWVFASKGSGVLVWESLFSAPAFTTGPTTWTKASNVSLSNATSTKQPITATSGAVVETSAKSQKQYWHNEFLP